MGNRNPNSTNYVHTDEPNLLSLHRAMDYDVYGKPVVRIHPNTDLQPNIVAYADNEMLSAYGRLRTSDAFLLGEYRYMYGSGTSVEMNDIVNDGTLAVDYVRVCAIGTVTTNIGSRIVRQTKQYHPYIAGTSTIGMMSFTLNQSKPGLVQQVGMFDDTNGIFLKVDSSGPKIVIRKNAIDIVISQSQWNVDRLNGANDSTNLSGINLDLTKSQLLAIDYQWLGVGRVRVGFVLNGSIHYVHYFNHANLVTEVYTNQPSLPCRWEIFNQSATTSSSQIMMIAAVVYSEGVGQLTGFERSVSTDGTIVPITSTTGQCVLAIKMKNTLVGKQNHAHAVLNKWTLLSTNDCHYKLVIFNDASTLVTPTWQQVPGYSWCDYTKNLTLTANWEINNDYNVLADDFVTGASGSISGATKSTTTNRTCTIYQNYDSTSSQVLAIIAYKLINNADVKASLSWTEIK